MADDLFGRPLLIVLKKGQQGLADAIVLEQPTRDTGIFCGDHINPL